MDLREYLRVNGMTQEDFAARAGVTQPTVSLCVNHSGPVSLYIALRVQHVTLNEVCAEDMPISDESRRSLQMIKSLARSGAFQ